MGEKLNKRKLQIFLDENKREVDKAMMEFEEHSRRFDKKIKEILAAL